MKSSLARNASIKSMMIIHNFSPGPVGGAELQAEKLAHHLVSRGHELHILTNSLENVASWFNFGGDIPYAPSEEIRESVWNNGQKTAIKIHRPQFLLAYHFIQGYLPTFRYLLQNRKMFDVLHCHLAYGHAVVAVVAAKILRKPCIIKFACAGEFGELAAICRFPGYRMALRVLQQADRVVSISRELERELLGHGFLPKRICYIPNGVDTEKFKKNEHTRKSDKTSFIFIGRLHPQKGVDIALRAVALLYERANKGCFEVIFYGLEYPEYDYRSMAIQLGIAESVKFMGFEPNILNAYQYADALILPSRNEGLSNTLLEAMSMSLPVIATTVSGNPDVITDGLDGLLIPSESPDALADAMQRLIDDLPLRDKLGKNARTHMVSDFSLDRIAARYENIYNTLLHRTR
jgi:glycosyltransferase involved in cell wall biosynthesis